MPKPWAEITKDEKYQALSDLDKQHIKSKYFEEVIVPRLNNLPPDLGVTKDSAYQAWMQTPDDSGQSYATSALSSVGRGALSILPNVVGGLGYVTDSESLIEAGQSIEGSINEALPINPVYEDTFGIKAFNAAGQAVGMLATGGTIGAAGRALGAAGAANAAVRGTMFGQGFLSGARQGGQTADQMGYTGADRVARSIEGGLIEVATETIPFGLGDEVAMASRGLRQLPAGQTLRRAALTESVEEGLSQVANNITDIAIAPEGYEAPGVAEGVVESMALGAIGGGVFGGANIIANRQQGQTNTLPDTEDEGQTSVPPPETNAPAAATNEPIQSIRLRGRDGGEYLRDTGGAWYRVGIQSGDESGSLLHPLDPTDVIDSANLTYLDAKAATIERQQQMATAENSTTQDAEGVSEELQSDAIETPTQQVDVVEAPIQPVEQEEAPPTLSDEVSYTTEDGTLNTGVITEVDTDTETATIELPGEEQPARVPLSQLMRGSNLAKWADDKIKDSKQNLNTGVDPVLMAALTVKAGIAIASGAADAAQWTAQMVSELGEKVKPYLQQAWDSAFNDYQSRAAENPDSSRFAPRTAANAAASTNAQPVGVEAPQQEVITSPPPTPPPSRNRPPMPDNISAQSREVANAKRDLAPNYRRISLAVERLKDGMQYVKSTRDQRTVDGEEVPVIVYEVRTDVAMQTATSNLMDEMLYQQIGGEDLKRLLSTGRHEGFGILMDQDERAILARHMIQSGRFVEFGVTRPELINIIQVLAGAAGMTQNQWRRVLDPMQRLQNEAEEKTTKDFTRTTGETPDKVFKNLENEFDKIKEETISPEARKALKKVRAKLNQKLAPGELADRLNNLFFPSEPSLAQKFYEDGARAIANAFFRGKPPQPEGPLNEGARFVKEELSTLLNEALDAIGVKRINQEADPDIEYRRLITQLGLGNMRSGKMEVIDQLVRERIGQYADEGATEFADDLLSQWEQVSAVMLGRSASGATLRRIVNAQLAEDELTVSRLAGMSQDTINSTITRIVDRAVSRTFNVPESGGLRPGAAEQLAQEMTTTARDMVRKAQEKIAKRREEQEKLRKSPQEVTRRANTILDSMARQLSDTPPTEAAKKEQDAVRSLISEALQADEDMTMLREMLMDLGVASDVAGSLELMVLESRRRAEAIEEYKKYARAQEARKKAITDMVDRLAGRKENKKKGKQLSKFLSNLVRADKFGILDKEMFIDAYANAFDLHYLTPAVVKNLRDLWQKITAVNERGRPVLTGMVRETAQRKFSEAVNAVSPGARWDNVIFDSYQAGVLSSISSIFNQFSGVFRVITGVDAFTRAVANGDPRIAAQEWWRNNTDLFNNLPLIMTGVRGESLGHLPSSINSNFLPREQSVQLTEPGQTLRIITPKGSTIEASENMRKLLRAKSLFTWRTIRGAEALSGITDANAMFREVLTNYYKRQGKSAAEAYRLAVKDIASTPEERAAAEAQARQEQRDGEIGKGESVIRQRVNELIELKIEERVGEDLIHQKEQLTAASQFKTPPVGVFGYPIYSLFNKIGDTKNPGSRVARFFFLFGRFLGHTVDTMMAYTPVMHAATLGRNGSDSPRNKLIKQIYGDTDTYNRRQHSKAAAGAAFVLMNGLLMALAELMAPDDDDEPFFQIFGTAPLASREQKEALIASGKWQEGAIRIFGVNYNYSQIPELAGLLTTLGNVSDYVKFSQQLYTKNSEVLPVIDAAIGMIQDMLASPIKRSTYRQYVDFVSKAMAGQKSDAFANIISSPVGGALRIPLVVDADKLYRQLEGGRDAKGIGQNFLRRIPFVHVGDKMMNSYGEEIPGLATIAALPEHGKSDNPDVVRAATINVETGTVRGMPKLPETLDGEPVTEDLRERYARISGRYYVESLLRNEESIRSAFIRGGVGAAKKIVANISSKANKRARKELGIDLTDK